MEEAMSVTNHRTDNMDCNMYGQGEFLRFSSYDIYTDMLLLIDVLLKLSLKKMNGFFGDFFAFFFFPFNLN